MKLKNKRGNYGSVFMFLVMAFLIVVFFGLMYWGFGQMNNVLTSVHFTMGNGEGYNNFSNVVSSTWGHVYSAYGQLKTLSYVLIIGMILTILISSWIVKSPPIFLVVYLITSIGSIILAVYLSNSYQTLLLNTTFGATLQSFKGASYLLLELPYVAAVVSVLSGLISLIGLNKNKTSNELPL